MHVISKAVAWVLATASLCAVVAYCARALSVSGLPSWLNGGATADLVAGAAQRDDRTAGGAGGTLRGATAPASPSHSGSSCSCGARYGDDPEIVTLHIVSTLKDYPIQNEHHGINAQYRTRTWCDGSKNESSRCDGLGIFGPPLKIRPGQRFRVMVRNDFDTVAAQELGPAPPRLEDWFPLVDSKSGRYAGMQDCGFVFVGKEPKSVAEFVQNVENMPGHRHAQFEVTNLHLHGLEITPHLFEPLGTGNPASEMVKIQPGECLCYEFDLPTDHASGGTYWYHPHMHSTSAIQAWSGMAGLIYVTGPLDDMLKAAGLEQDHPFVIWDPHFRVMDRAPGQDEVSRETGDESIVARKLLLGPRQPIGVDHFLRDQTDQSRVWYLVNAEYRPTFSVRPSEPMRLRLLCGTTENLAGFEIVDDENRTVSFWQLGSDGIIYNRAVQRSRLVLAGGQREEIAVSLPAVGRYRVVTRGLSKVQFFCTGPPDLVLAEIVVSGAEWPVDKRIDFSRLVMPAPKTPIAPEEIVESRTITMSMKADRSRVPFPQFLQNGKPYNETAVEVRVKAGTAEEWILMNPDHTTHPFHVHVNPFQVKEIYSSFRPEDPAMQVQTELNASRENWRDTVIVPPMGAVKIWIRFRPDMKGKTVAHCHFLAHEDTGMMMNILIE
eukprot:TRINITY_DN34764_c0_g1_i1.p1 TRINITY_DN34764_c0_g1~~TRINITY_DN34764_c0_g1_i1.p1  ORF type:complete len:662 (+),score=68.29 TRINITY_DN34764_c0_g1_i1:65-2050(+)